MRGPSAVNALRRRLEPSGPLTVGQFLFRVGDPFRALWIVQSGAVKSCHIDVDGYEHVLSFHFPGEVFALDAIYPGYYRSDAIAIEPTVCCRFSLSAVGALALRYPEIQREMLRLLSKELDLPSRTVGRFYADERVAAFLLDLGARCTRCGQSGRFIHTSMTRGDIGNYLHLAGETVSRVLTRFRANDIIAVNGRDIELLDPSRLRYLAR